MNATSNGQRGQQAGGVAEKRRPASGRPHGPGPRTLFGGSVLLIPYLLFSGIIKIYVSIMIMVN